MKEFVFNNEQLTPTTKLLLLFMIDKSKNGKKTALVTVDGVPDCVAANGARTAVASGNEITVYSSNGKESKKIETEHTVKDVFWCAGSIYTVENGHIYKY